MASKKRKGLKPIGLIQPDSSIEELRTEVQSCQGCDIWKHATQAVFGEGASGAEVMFVGEQPGTKEDLEGHPFVGPAGKVLDQALNEAAIDREHVYVTNVVKHFKSTTRGKFRIHKKPNPEEIAACRPWLDAEISRLRPKAIVCLGATAAQALISKSFRVTQDRAKMLKSPLASLVTATVHPSSILRASDHESRVLAMKQFVADLKVIAGRLPATALRDNQK